MRRGPRLLKRYLSAAHRDSQTLGCPLPAVVGEIGTAAPQHGKVLAEQIQAMASRLGTYLPAGSRLIAIGLVALMYGGLSLARALKGTVLSDEVLRACRALGAAAIRGVQRGR
jgi:TetR/AcrR family transcriptional repressor of nem operon